MKRFVYFAANEAETVIKIGSSSRPNCRISSLRIANGRMAMIAAYPGSFREEKRVQRLFADLQIPGASRELFHYSQAIIDYAAERSLPIVADAPWPYHCRQSITFFGLDEQLWTRFRTLANQRGVRLSTAVDELFRSALKDKIQAGQEATR